MTGSESHHDPVLHVVMNLRVTGEIQRTGKRSIRLRYHEPEAAGFTPLSVSMPDSQRRYREKVLTPWLAGLLPDRPETVRQWRRRFGVPDDEPFSLLVHVGEDVAGAAQLVRPNRLDDVLSGPGDVDPLRPDQIAEMLRRARADLPTSTLDDSGAPIAGTFSLAGAQAKIALHHTQDAWGEPSGAIPSTHILKPAVPGMEDQDLVEAVTMRTAAEMGLAVALCRVVEFADERAIVVRRYDRVKTSGRWTRVHQEDMGQALGLWPWQKYEMQGGPSAARVADLISRTSSRPEDDARRFAQALVFNWLVCGTDAHARNYSLLISRESVRLAPLYDLNAHLAYSNGTGVDLSMSVNGTYRAARLTLDDWEHAAPALRVDPEWLRAEIERQGRHLPAAMARVAAGDDVARYGSRTIDRLLATTEAWVRARTR